MDTGHAAERRIGLALAWLEEHLAEEVGLDDLARAAGYSPFHFHRLFYLYLGETVAEYVRARRLAVAAQQLRTTAATAAAIAHASGFGTQAVFTRAFKRSYGVTPGKFRRHTMTQLNPPRIVELADTWLVGVEVTTDTAKDRNITKAWGQFMSVCAAIPGAAPNSPSYGLERYAPDAEQRRGAFSYLAGVAADPGAALPAGTTARKIPGGRYAVFTHQGSTERLGETFGYIYGVWLPASGETLRGMAGSGAAEHGFDFERYDERFRDGSPDSELDIYVPLS